MNSGRLHALNSCRTVRVAPAMVSAPLREPTVGATVKVTEPLPRPVTVPSAAALLNLIHGRLLRAVHSHCESGLVIATVAVPPVEGRLKVVGPIVKRHATAAKSARSSSCKLSLAPLRRAKHLPPPH